MKELDFSDYKFRCSQLYKLMTGTIGLTEQQEYDMKCLNIEKETGVNINGNAIKWSPNKEDKLTKLKAEFNHPTIPKTMQTELRKIYRMEKYKRNFPYTNRYIQKGLVMEDEAITAYQSFRNARGIRTFFVKNGHRLFGEYFQGEPDLNPVKVMEGKYKGLMCGFDIKNSYDLSTFPFPEDPLVDQYDCQNQGYLKLTGADLWITASVLGNGTEQHVHNEKLKWMYALTTQKDGTPESNPEHPYYEEYVQKCREVERVMIYDYNRFVDVNPFHLLEHTKEEWNDEGYDIPLEDRIIEKISLRDDEKIAEMENRCKIGRKYLHSLQRQDQNKQVLI